MRSTASVDRALTVCVAPNSRDHSSLWSNTSTAITLPAPINAAAWIALSPTPPQPKTTTFEPGVTLARLITAPAPVITPQLTRHTTSSGASLRIGTTFCSGRTAFSAYEDTCRKWKTSFRFLRKRVVPSCIRWRGLSRRSHRFGRPTTQYGQRPQLGTYDVSTWSPTLTPLTLGPTASTTPEPSCPST